METITIVFFTSVVAIFWVIALRFYYRLCVEMSQYAQSPLKSPLIRTVIIGSYGLCLNISFILICLFKSTIFSDVFGSNPTVLLVLIFLLLFFSPIFNYLFIYTYTIGSQETILTSSGLILALVSAIVIFLPFCYVLYKTRKEIELRFNIAIGKIPKKLPKGLKRHHVFHGNPILCGFMTILSGLLFFPWCLYYDLFKGKQGLIVYQKNKIIYDVIKEERVIADVGNQLSAVDKAMMKNSDILLCPRCKKPLIYLEEQKKWWCKKCKRAG